MSDHIVQTLKKQIIEFIDELIVQFPDEIDFVLHGHTHLTERISWLNDIPLYNVCVEATNYYPLKLTEVIAFHKKTLRDLRGNGR